MAKTSVYDRTGNKIGEIELNDSVFGIEPNESVLHQSVVTYLANQRQGTQSALTRAEVSGGGRKPWRQKGTGRARQGSTRSPQWTHGGIVFAPKPRSYRMSMNKKAKKLAMCSALSAKVKADEMIVLDELALSEIKTKTVAEVLKALGAEKKTLLICPEMDRNIVLSARNMPGVTTTMVGSLNVYDILNADKCVIIKDAVGKIEEVYA